MEICSGICLLTRSLICSYYHCLVLITEIWQQPKSKLCSQSRTFFKAQFIFLKMNENNFGLNPSYSRESQSGAQNGGRDPEGFRVAEINKGPGIKCFGALRLYPPRVRNCHWRSVMQFVRRTEVWQCLIVGHKCYLLYRRTIMLLCGCCLND